MATTAPTTTNGTCDGLAAQHQRTVPHGGQLGARFHGGWAWRMGARRGLAWPGAAHGSMVADVAHGRRGLVRWLDQAWGSASGSGS
jgi:hypothetical protein